MGIGGLAMAGVIGLLVMFKLRKLWVSLLFSAVSGLGALYLVNLAGTFTGVWLPMNFFSVPVAALGGIPGVITLLLLRIIWPL